MSAWDIRAGVVKQATGLGEGARPVPCGGSGELEPALCLRFGRWSKVK